MFKVAKQSMESQGPQKSFQNERNSAGQNPEHFLHNPVHSVQYKGKASAHMWKKISEGNGCLKTIKPLLYEEEYRRLPSG